MDLPNVPEFPVNSLPEPLRDYVLRYAVVLDVPAGMIATPLLVAGGAALGNTARLQLKRGFTQTAGLYGAVVAHPGKTKSPALKVAVAPLWALQLQAKRDYDEEHAAWKIEVAAAKAAPKSEKRHIPDEPTMKDIVTTDATVEALFAMHGDGPGLLIVRDELAGLVAAFDQYKGGKGSDKQAMLQAWAQTPVKIDRKSGPPAIIDDPVIAVIGGIQPDMLQDLLTHVDSDGGVLRDGFLDRFIFDYPDTKPTRWNDNEANILLDGETLSLFAQLRNPPGGLPPESITVRLSADAKALWTKWFNDNAKQTDDASGLRAGFFSKMPLQLARLALILHAFTNPGDIARDVSAVTMTAAITLVEFYRANAIRTLSHYKETSSSDPLDKKIRTLLDAADGGWLTRTEIYNKLGRNDTRDDIGKVLEALKAEGFAEMKSEPTGGRPIESWRRVPPNL